MSLSFITALKSFKLHSLKSLNLNTCILQNNISVENYVEISNHLKFIDKEVFLCAKSLLSPFDNRLAIEKI